jgi:hypothetical protein
MEPPTWASRRRIGHEPLGGQRRSVQIPASDTDPANIQFTRHANRNRLTLRIQNVRLDIRNRITDGHDSPRAAGSTGPKGHAYRCFGWADYELRLPRVVR